MDRITEQPSPYRHQEKMTIEELTKNINNEDRKVASAIEKSLPQLNKLISAIVIKLKAGGRLFYIGCGSGGRLSVLDAIELPTTFGIPRGMVNVILAGGIENLIRACEEMEDDRKAGWKMLEENDISSHDIVVGVSASGTTPFVLSALKACQQHGVTTGCIVSNPDAPISKFADHPVEIITGPEFLTGSTRMKAGSVQKMVFDMISTTTMIQLGRVEDNRMVNMRLLNDKMVDRSVKMVMLRCGIENYDQAKELLLEHGSVKKVEEALKPH